MLGWNIRPTAKRTSRSPFARRCLIRSGIFHSPGLRAVQAPDKILRRWLPQVTRRNRERPADLVAGNLADVPPTQHCHRGGYLPLENLQHVGQDGGTTQGQGTALKLADSDDPGAECQGLADFRSPREAPIYCYFDVRADRGNDLFEHLDGVRP